MLRRLHVGSCYGQASSPGSAADLFKLEGGLQEDTLQVAQMEAAHLWYPKEPKDGVRHVAPTQAESTDDMATHSPPMFARRKLQVEVDVLRSLR